MMRYDQAVRIFFNLRCSAGVKISAFEKEKFKFGQILHPPPHTLILLDLVTNPVLRSEKDMRI